MKAIGLEKIQDGEHLRAGHPDAISTARITAEARGDRNKQFSLYKEVLENHPVASIVLAHAVSGYLRGFKDFETDHSPIMHVWGQPGGGKSLIGKMAAAIQSNPTGGNNFVSGSSTKVGLELLLAEQNNGFLVIDDINSFISTNKNPVSALVNMANGSSGLKSSNMGQSLAKSKSWLSSLIFTGNIDFSQFSRGHNQEDSLRGRTIEIDTLTSPIFPQDMLLAWRYEDSIYANYGHLYEPIINYIKDNEEAIQANIDVMIAGCRAALSQSKSPDRSGRKTITFSYIYAALQVLMEVTGAEENSSIEDKLMDMFSGETNRNQDEGDTALEIRDRILDITSTVSDMISVDGHIAKTNGHLISDDGIDGLITPAMSQVTAAREHNVKLGKVIGYATQKKAMTSAFEFTGIVRLKVSAANKIKRATGHDLIALARSAKAAGFLKQSKSDLEQNRLASNAGGGRGRCYIFDLGLASELIAEN